jgi:hypothetical protein
MPAENALRNDAAATRVLHLGLGPISQGPVFEPRRAAVVEPAQRPDEVGNLLDDLLLALLDLPGDA